MKKHMRKWFPTKNNRQPVVQPTSRRRCLVETLEARQMMTASALSTGVGSAIEFNGPFGTFMPVGAPGYDSKINNVETPVSSFGLISVPASGFGLNSGSSAVSSLNLNLYNTATSGTFAPVAGEFGVYLVPEDTVPASSMEYQGGVSSTNTDLAAIGTTSGGASTLGISASDLVGTFNVTSALPKGYSTFTFNSLSAAVQSGIDADINNNQPLRLIVVAENVGGSTGEVDWDGNFSGSDPQVSLNVTQAPLVNFASSNFAVTEADQTAGHTTTDTVTINRTSAPSTTTTINYTMTDGTATSPAGYTNQSGSVTFAPGVTSMTFPVVFNNITTSQATGTVNLSLSQSGANSPQAVFPNGGTTATATINYLQANTVSLDASSYSVNENAGTATIQVDRSGTNLSSTTTVNYSTADGTPYLSDPTNPDDAQAGRDYTATTGTVTFAPGQTTQTFTVPILNVNTFAGTRSFNVSLSSPSTGNSLGATTSSTIKVTDNTVAGDQTPTGYPTYSAGIQTNGPYYVNSYVPLVSTPGGAQNYSDFPEIEFGPTSAVYPSTYAAGAVNSVQLSIYNTANTGTYSGTPGSFDVYALLDDTGTAPDAGLKYQGGTGNTGSTVIGSQAGAVYIGTAYFPNNQVGYNNVVFDNLPTAVSTAFTNDLNAPTSSTPLRFAIVPTSGSTVLTDWEGNSSINAPKLTLLVQPTTQTVETFNVSSAGATVSKTAGTETITVNRTSTGDVADSATVNYATSDGFNGVGGTPYNGTPAVAGTDYTAESGVLTFAPGQTSATITVPITNTASYGDKSFTVSLSNWATGDGTRLAKSTSSSEVVTITDPRTVDIAQSASDLSSVSATGPGANTTYWDVQPTGSFAEFAVADYNQPGVLPYNVPSTVGRINQINLSTVAGFPIQTWETSGNLNVYLVTNTTTSIDAGSSPLVYDSTDDPTSGLGSQLGTSYLLGTIGFNAGQTTDNFTSIPLTNANSTAMGMLVSALNNGTDFRIVVAPGDSTVAASFEGFFSNSTTGLYEAPIVSINYTPASELTGALPPTVAAGGGTATYSIGGSAQQVDGGLTMATTETDGDITGATMKITNYQTGDTLNFTSGTDGVNGSWDATNHQLVLSNTTTAANYQLAMRTVTFSTANNSVTTARTIAVQGDDTFASPTTGNTVTETVNISLAPPTVTTTVTPSVYTAGAPASGAGSSTVDNGITVSSAGPVTSATMTITPGTLQSGDSLNFTNGTITGSYTAGTGTLVLTGTASTTAAQFQTALRSVTFSNATNNSLASRSVTVVAVDSNANNPGTASTAATDTVQVAAPLKVSGLYVRATGSGASNWAAGFTNYLSSTGLGNTSTPTLGFALQTGSNQSKVLPWVNVNVIEATFNEAPTGIGLSSLVLSGGTGGSTPSVTGFSQLNSTTFAWTLSTVLTRNRLEVSFLNSGLTDSRGAHLSGNWTNASSTFPSGNGLAGNGTSGPSATSDFNFLFNSLPGDVLRGGAVVSTTEYTDVKAKLNAVPSSTNYNPYYDVTGAGLITSTDATDVRGQLNKTLPSNAPGPQSSGVGSLGDAALAVQEGSTGQTGGSAAPALSNQTSGGGSSSSSGSSASSSSSSLGGSSSSSSSSSSDADAADEAISDFDLADLWA